MHKIISHFNRKLVGLTIGFVFLATSVLAILPHTTYAAGEAFKFIDVNTIQMSGGDVGRLVTLKLTAGKYVGTYPTSTRGGTTTVTLTVGTKIAAGGYNAGVTIAFSGVQRGPIPDTKVKVDDPNGVGPQGGSKPGGAAGAGAAGVATDPVCEDFGGRLGWVFCPLISLMDQAINELEEAINNLLSVDRLYGNTSGPVYQLWATVRNISLLVLIPMMMLMVIGTAIDMGPFDPYTVKKALPRMVYAAIFILLSWSICTFFIDMSDVIGAGIVNFLTNVGADGNGTLASIIGPGAATGLFEGLILGTTVGFATGALSFGILGSLALVTSLTFLMGYLALLFRQMLILGLLVFAPAAILVWIFPGNDKLWTVWKASFIGLLAVYPIVGAMIGMGRVAANIVSKL